MTATEVLGVLSTCRTKETDGNQGALVHVTYHPFREGSDLAREQSQRARDLGLPLDHYTGRLDRVFTNNNQQLCFTLLVELERADSDGRPVFRTFNSVEGQVLDIQVIEE